MNPAAPEEGRWRPQGFGPRRPRDLVDPLVEPVWSGLRVLVFLGHGRARFVDADGADLAVADDLPTLLGQALLAEEAVLEGYLVAGPPGDGTGIVPETVSPPPAGAFLRQMLLGGSARRARRGRQAAAPCAFRISAMIAGRTVWRSPMTA